MCANLGESRSICFLAAVVAGTLRPHSAATGQKRGLKTIVGRENTDSPKLKASDLAEKIRQEKKQTKETKTEGPSSPVLRRVRELHQFSQQLQRVHPNVLAKDLKRGILLANEQLVAINKPYGVPVHGGPGVKNSIADVLPVLAKMIGGMKAGPLHLCHRLDKETTGVMLLGKSEEAADHIHQLFKTHQVEKKYWVLSVGVPVPSEGVIDIPIIEKEIAGPQPHYKMSLSPLYRISEEGQKVSRVRANREAHSAVTQYRVLDSAGGCSLVELQPITGVKHQIRVHMAYGLGCQILGDHKYANWSKLAPQKLPEKVLQRLGLEQSKARHLPLHLHARGLILPGAPGVSLSCPLPRFFLGSLRRLGIQLPEQ
ncbi:RUSD4 synthase, partial [Atractosteus spatula]|nr:RUSD4 synthase [Atractosteus spatula]